MKWIRTLAAVVATLGLSGVAQAGIFSTNSGCWGAAKCCGCASTCQPSCCKPTITRPCGTSVHVYQRKCSDIKPPCCNTCCAPQGGCAPAAQGCAPAPQACAAPAPQNCAPAPQACAAPAPQNCAPAPQACAAPAPQSCAPAPQACAAPAANTCCAPAPQSCCQPVQCCQTRCCNADPCEVARLIYESQTCCYAKDRRSAIHCLGDQFDCVCNPEIMCAFVYALNDSDERVRAKAADEIGDQLRKNCCCCSPEIVSALTCALADCDWKVRRQAEEALEACGYEIVDGCCNVCSTGCTSGACGACGSAPAPAPAGGEAAPAPAPPMDADAYFPSRLDQRQTKRAMPKRHRLADLFGLLD